MALIKQTRVDQVLIKAKADGTVEFAAWKPETKIIDDANPGAAPTFVQNEEFRPVESTGPYSLPSILGSLQAATVAARDSEKSAKEAKQAEVDALKAELATARAELKALKNPPNLVRIGVLRRAIKALDIAKRWDTAVDATVAALTTAKADDPKRIVTWWESDTPAPIDTLGDDWRAIIKEIKLPAGMTEATILAKIAEVAATAGNAGA